MNQSSVPESVEALFQSARHGVTSADIAMFAPQDPGYDDYVRVWSKIHWSGIVPEKPHFDLTEVIAMASWTNPSLLGERGDQFRAYRRLTSAVALMLIHRGSDVDNVRPAVYLARDLLIDIDPSAENDLSTLRSAFQVTRSLLRLKREWEFPFFTLGSLILAQFDGDWSSSECAAEQLLADESEARSLHEWVAYSDEFLLGLTVYDQLHGDWRRLIAGLQNPTRHETTELLIQAFRGEPT